MAVEATLQQSVYVETTISSYYTARPSRDVIVLGRQELTRDWWENQSAQYALFVSQTVIDEVSRGDPAEAAKRMVAIADIDILEVHDDAERLAQSLVSALGIPGHAIADAVHLAYAIYYEIDYLLTWNCTHLANAHTIRRLTDYARREDVWLPIVCTPQELVDEFEENSS